MTALILALAFVQPSSTPVWRLSSAPILSFGGDSQPDVEFLRIGTVKLRPDGSVLVANGEPPEIHLFDSKGILTRKLGRLGDGPGEFRRLGWVSFLGDSVVGYDYGHRSLTVFGPDGKVLPSRPLPSSKEAPYGLSVGGRLSCGAWLALPSQAMGHPGQNGVVRDTTFAFILTPSLQHVAHRLGPFLGMATVVMRAGGGRMGVGMATFGPTTLSGVADSLIYTLDTATPELHLWDCNGQRRSTLTIPVPEGLVLLAVVERLKQEALTLATSEAGRALTESRFASANLPKRLPRVRGIVPGTMGTLWLEQYEADPQAPSTWWILDLRGKVLASLQTPKGFRIYFVLRDRVAGVHRDDDGVESVRVYQLQR